MKIYVGCVTVNVVCVINQFSLHSVIVCNLLWANRVGVGNEEEENAVQWEIVTTCA